MCVCAAGRGVPDWKSGPVGRRVCDRLRANGGIKLLPLPSSVLVMPPLESACEQNSKPYRCRQSKAIRVTFSAVFTECLKIVFGRANMSLSGRNEGGEERKLLLKGSGSPEFSLGAFQACSCFKLPAVLLNCLSLLVRDLKKTYRCLTARMR